MQVEEQLKSLILQKYGTLKNFALEINVPYTTIDNIFRRGLMKANIVNIVKICTALSISADGLASGEIVFRESVPVLSPAERQLLLLFDNLNSDGQSEILRYAEYVASKPEYKKYSKPCGISKDA